MAYSRFLDADVYIYMSVGGTLECCGCWLGKVDSTVTYIPTTSFHSTETMIAHIAEHRAAGHNVPDGLEDQLRRDDEWNFPPQCADGHDWGEPFHPYGVADSMSRAVVRRKCKRCHWES